MSYTSPILTSGQSSRALKRIPLGNGERAFSEAWLQQLLFENPQSLPLREIAPHMAAIAPVCIELNTLAGPADILYVSATGQVVLVETKLWRNPEARRTVVAQILDYAKELSSWHYEDLAREVARATGKGADHLLQTAKSAFAGLDERAFVDGITHSLRTGEIVLLIVGDGIRSGTEALVGFLERYGNLRFSFGLVEVAAYELDAQVLLIPRVLAKTEVVRRTVVVPVDQMGQEIILTASEHPGVTATTELEPEQAEQTEYGQWLLAFWAAFMTKLHLDDRSQPKPIRTPKSTNAFFPMPPGGAFCWVSAYVAKSSDEIGVYLTFSRNFDRGVEAYAAMEADRETIDKELGAGAEWVAKADGTRTVILVRQLQDWRDPTVCASHVDFLSETTNRFVNAFRPRLQAYFRETN